MIKSFSYSPKKHNKARHIRTASCAGLAHSSLACACGRYVFVDSEGIK